MAILPKQLTLSHYDKLSKEHFNPPHNHFVKPFGGLWSSSYTPDAEYSSAWHEFCSEEFESGLRPFSILFDINKESRVYTIDSQMDLIDLILKYGYYDDGSAKFLAKAGLEPFCLYPNFEKISKDLDVIYLTEKGQWETRIPIEHYNYNLYGWDIECSLILNFDIVENQSLLE